MYIYVCMRSCASLSHPCYYSTLPTLLFRPPPPPLHFLFFFSVSIPLKNVRKRRFRKTANKKVYHTPNQHNTHMGCPCKASCRPHAGLMYGPCRPHAGFMQASCMAPCRLHTGLMQAHAGLIQASCRPHALVTDGVGTQ